MIPKAKILRNVACLQALIAAKLTFRELLQVVVPMTVWWKDRKIQEQLAEKFSARRRSAKRFAKVQECLNLQEDEDSGRRRSVFHPTYGAGSVCGPRWRNLTGERTWQLRPRDCRRLGTAKRSSRGRDELVALSKAIQSVPATDRKEASVW